MSTASARTHAPHFMEALPPYLGGKRRLTALIFSLLAETIPRSAWPSTTLLDPFSGGGAVALAAKAYGFNVTASDLAERAVTVDRALIANSTVRLQRTDIVDLFVEAEGTPMAMEHVPQVFTEAQAIWIDRALARSEVRAEPVRSLLRLVIIKFALRCQPMSMLTASDAEAAASGDFDRVSPRRIGHYLKAQRPITPDAIWRIAEQVNTGVFGGEGVALQGDACEVIASTQADVLYLDPPYASTTGYRQAYGVLDQLLGDRGPPEHPVPDLEDLLSAAQHIPLVLLSYGGPTTTLNELTALVARHRPVIRALAVPYPHLRSIANMEEGDDNKELLIVAGRE